MRSQRRRLESGGLERVLHLGAPVATAVPQLRDAAAHKMVTALRDKKRFDVRYGI
jgi:hypothetical protein